MAFTTDPRDLSRLSDRVARLLTGGEVKVDGKGAHAVPSSGEVEEVLLPLLRWCAGHTAPTGRGLVGIAAPPAAGKTHLLAWLQATARALEMTDVAFLSMDGYHLPNAVLDARTGVDPEGKTVPLRALKGTPPTFDAPALLEDLRALKASRAERLLPIYSRERHDPLPGALRIGPEVAWVLIEGNYLFLTEPPWNEIAALLDRRVFITAEEELLRRRLSERHARAGRSAEWIEAHYRRTDGPNIHRVLAMQSRADLVLAWDSQGRLRLA